MSRQRNLVVFENGSPIRLKSCGCDHGEVVKEKVKVSDIYSPEEIQQMDLDSDKELDEYFMCSNCEQKLEEL